MDLNSISTRDLVEELKQRSGVKTTIVEPYEQHKIDVEGPAIVLEVID